MNVEFTEIGVSGQRLDVRRTESGETPYTHQKAYGHTEIAQQEGVPVALCKLQMCGGVNVLKSGYRPVAFKLRSVTQPAHQGRVSL